MRIKNNKTIISNTKKKFFLAFEGVKTEVQYFDGIINNRDKIGINKDIEIIPLLRNHPFIGWSNPIKAFERTKLCLDNLKNNQRNVSALISSIVEYCFYTSPVYTKKEDAIFLYDTLSAVFINKFNLSLNENIKFDDERINMIINEIEESLSSNFSIYNLENFINSQFVSFNPKVDKVCLIVDRDKRSVNSEQYDDLLNKCKENSYDLYVSNPCFEFFLLLHFDEIFNLDMEKLFENRKVGVEEDSLHYSENELKKLIPDFEKNNICFDKLIERIPIAIENSKKFQSSVTGLKDQLGSNLSILLKELIN